MCINAWVLRRARAPRAHTRASKKEEKDAGWYANRCGRVWRHIWGGQGRLRGSIDKGFQLHPWHGSGQGRRPPAAASGPAAGAPTAARSAAGAGAGVASRRGRPPFH